MRTLILSNTTYTWTKHCIGLITQNPELFQIIIIYKDDDRPLYRLDTLCEDAVYVQRTTDLFKIGKYLGIKKISNFGCYKDNIDVEKLSAQIQLSIMLGGVRRIAYQYDPLIENILKSLRKNTGVELYGYDVPPNSNQYDLEVVKLSTEDKIKKFELRKFMVGIGTKSELPDYSESDEYLYKLR